MNEQGHNNYKKNNIWINHNATSERLDEYFKVFLCFTMSLIRETVTDITHLQGSLILHVNFVNNSEVSSGLHMVFIFLSRMSAL